MILSLHKRPAGFTLIELMITIAVIAILASVALPMAELAAQRGKEQDLRLALRQLRTAIDEYKQVVYSVQDNYTSPVEPTDAMTFSLYGIVDFTVQGWSGSSWVTLGTVSGNNLVKRTVNFAAYTTDRIRINITSALANYSRLTEVEAWGTTVETPL